MHPYLNQSQKLTFQPDGANFNVCHRCSSFFKFATTSPGLLTTILNFKIQNPRRNPLKLKALNFVFTQVGAFLLYENPS